ncbi:Uncharacterized protein HZ326_7252 [Fusarium oxysporum f. sp. albedinis]|nr:Uncharacterized protein HZ326_7252 [Fusarium oxysporum f. sp. albedinis]
MSPCLLRDLAHRANQTCEIQFKRNPRTAFGLGPYLALDHHINPFGLYYLSPVPVSRCVLVLIRPGD